MRKKNVTNKINNIENIAVKYAKIQKDDIFAELNSTQKGLTAENAELRLEEEGLNEINYGKNQPWFMRLILSFANPFSLVLVFVAVVTIFTDVLFSREKSWATVIIIFSLIVISSLLQFFQESKSDKAAEKLKAMVSSNAAVMRDGIVREMPMQEIVRGDMIHLSAGDMIPADVRILSAKDLFISQAALTGESEPVEKYDNLLNASSTALEASNIAYMGTNVLSGSATAIVIETGNNTYFGSIAKDLTGHRAQSSFERGVANVSKILVRLMMIMVPIVFVINGLTKNSWIDALLFALSVAVGITPELLP
ncbi:MAG: HAD-IC family P-type ATPase, partial [Bacillota bacterium]|nr:HAD-IC family P-type ATPase [Bacillota bacterium]